MEGRLWRFGNKWANIRSMPLLPQRLQAGDAADIALPPGGNAVAHPMLFGLDLAVEFLPVALLLRQHLVAPVLERCKAAIEVARLAAVDPHGGARQVGEKAAVMADDDEGGLAAVELAFQPFVAGKSKWLVGSSSSKISGEGASTRASAARRASPPDSACGFSSPRKPSCSNR